MLIETTLRFSDPECTQFSVNGQLLAYETGVNSKSIKKKKPGLVDKGIS